MSLLHLNWTKTINLLAECALYLIVYIHLNYIQSNLFFGCKGGKIGAILSFICTFFKANNIFSGRRKLDSTK